MNYLLDVMACALASGLVFFAGTVVVTLLLYVDMKTFRVWEKIRKFANTIDKICQ